jgi:prepilin-type N-terminal cleavage/methylation domain-containing protein
MPDNNFKLSNKGLSMVELLLSLALVGLMVAVALPNLRGFSKTQEIDSAAATLVDVLKNAQSSASSHIKCPDGTAPVNWNVILNGSNYVLNCSAASNQQVSTRSYKGDPNSPTTFTLATDKCTPLTFIFANQQLIYQCGGVDQAAWPVRITFSGAGGTLTKVVIVEAGGVIRVE